MGRLLIVVVSIALTLPAAAQPRAPIFVFHTNDLMLNVHHFLYVLGRNEAAMPDRARRAVVDAPKDAESGLTTLTLDEQKMWRDAVTLYAQGPAKQDLVFDAPLVKTTQALGRVSDPSGLTGSGVDPAIAVALERPRLYIRKPGGRHIAAPTTTG